MNEKEKSACLLPTSELNQLLCGGEVNCVCLYTSALHFDCGGMGLYTVCVGKIGWMGAQRV